MDWRDVLRKSGLERRPNDVPVLAPEPKTPDHSYPRQNPEQGMATAKPSADPLGPPLTTREVARLIGCSPWFVRQHYLGAGLPYHRLGKKGRLIFYRNQVIRWLIARQEKAGTLS